MIPYDSKQHNIKYAQGKVLEYANEINQVASILIKDSEALLPTNQDAADKICRLAALLVSIAGNMEVVAKLGFYNGKN